MSCALDKYTDTIFFKIQQQARIATPLAASQDQQDSILDMQCHGNKYVNNGWYITAADKINFLGEKKTPNQTKQNNTLL